MKAKTPLLRAELIIWEDSFSSNEEWTSLAKCDFSPTVAATLGYVVYEDKRRVALAQTVLRGGGEVCCVFMIPKGSIIKRKKIKA